MTGLHGLRRLADLLTPRERRQGVVVLCVMLLVALLESAGVASVMPFLAVLGNHDLVESNDWLRVLYDRGGFQSVESFLFALGVASFILVVASALFRIAATYATSRYSQNRRYTLGARLLQVYLRQPYEFFLNRNSADLSKSVLSETDAVVNHVLKPLLELVSYGLVVLVMMALLVAVDPMLAVMITGIIGGLYAVIYLSLRGLLRRMGKGRIQANRGRFQAASEAFGGIKDLKVLGREDAYLREFRLAASAFARHYYRQQTLSASPKYLIEAVGFGGILALALGLMVTRGDLGYVLPLLGLYAFAGYRLLPAAQHVYAGMTALRFGWPAVDAMHTDLNRAHVQDPRAAEAVTPARLSESLRFDAVSFSYPGSDILALADLALTIPARSSVAFVGQTGAGKSTAVDLILGLLRPTQGRILIDGTPMDEVGVRSWQRAIGYVPQFIYLADASVAENIAFGVRAERIDMTAVERAARIANIHDFVVSELPRGYRTKVGERGVRLSGGQRQRIGIARAVYHDPEVLVLDEATSALDSATERGIMKAVEQLSGRKTLIMIAHRMSTVRNCDQIVVLEQGRVHGVGTYGDLERSNPAFRRLAVA